jgi:hypothetical protein
VLLEVPNAAVNLFDYAVADHLTHFTPETLAYLIERAGFQIRRLATDWVAKEISLVPSQQARTKPFRFRQCPSARTELSSSS